MSDQKLVIIGGSAGGGKTFLQKKKIEYLRKHGKKVFVVGEKDNKEVK